MRKRQDVINTKINASWFPRLKLQKTTAFYDWWWTKKKNVRMYDLLCLGGFNQNQSFIAHRSFPPINNLSTSFQRDALLTNGSQAWNNPTRYDIIILYLMVKINQSIKSISWTITLSYFLLFHSAPHDIQTNDVCRHMPFASSKVKIYYRKFFF